MQWCSSVQSILVTLKKRKQNGVICTLAKYDLVHYFAVLPSLNIMSQIIFLTMYNAPHNCFDNVFMDLIKFIVYICLYAA